MTSTSKRARVDVEVSSDGDSEIDGPPCKKFKYEALGLETENYVGCLGAPDLTVVCQKHTFHVHKSVLSDGSMFFKGCCNPNMREAQDGVVRLENDDPFVIEAMITTFYERDYDAVTLKAANHTAAMVFHVRVHKLAVEFVIPNLMELSTKRFKMLAAEQYLDESFAEACREIHGTIPDHERELRDVVVEVVTDHLQALVETGSHFRKALDEVPGLGSDMTVALAARLAGQH